MTPTAVPLLRLFQLADSGFPVGGFVYSHGVEWIGKQVPLNETTIASLVHGYLDQVGGGQWLPAALAASKARSLNRLIRVDESLDASIPAASERDAGRAMGERLLTAAAEAFDRPRGPSRAAAFRPADEQGRSAGSRREAFHDAIGSGRTPGQYPVAFGAIAQDLHIAAPEMLAVLAQSMAGSVVQAAVRLNHIGQFAAVRIVGGAAPQIDSLVSAALSAPARSTFGAFTPALDVAGLLHPTLQFRMFAS